TEGPSYSNPAARESAFASLAGELHVGQFVQRYPPALGGSEAYTGRLCAYLAACGDRVTVFTSTAIELAELWGERPTHPPTRREGAGGVGLRRYAPRSLPARRYILKALSLLPVRRWQCLTSPCNPICPDMWRDAGRFAGPLDAVHATCFPYSFPIACGLRLARRRGVPFLLTPFLHLGDRADPHDRTRAQYTRPHLTWLLKQADRVFVQTRAERDAVLALGVAEACVVLQGLGVDPRECAGGNREAVRVAWGLAPGEVAVGHLANNSAEKGTTDLLRAAEIARAQGRRFRVILAGPEMPNFRAFWHSFGPKDRVVRLGVLSESQRRDFFAGIDCFALPSRTDSFGLVLLEAWANGLPNLVYRAGGPAELVRHEIDGLQAKCGDVGELAIHLGRLASREGLRTELGGNGLARVAAEFGWKDKLELVRQTVRDACVRS
ncbi:MAG: glycosyltransferase family 4 protein, partial [Gemmataceae bacterium]|nr:glycosyltransferase family 4 protein [Gemmataceae bacterium]